MGREIKFRRSHFMDEQCTQFHHSDFWGVNVGIMGAIFTAPSTNNTALYFIDDQFTGKLDKNEVEVYESDIVTTKSPQLMIVSWSERFASFVIEREGWMFKHWFGEAFDGTDCEVIGNIYQNPELL